MGLFPYCLSLFLLGPFRHRQRRQSAGSAVKGDGPVGAVQGHVVCADLDLHRREVGPQARLLDEEGGVWGIVAGRML